MTFHQFLSECDAVDYFSFERFSRHFVLEKTGRERSNDSPAASFAPAADPGRVHRHLHVQGHLLTAATTVVIAPVLILFLFAQRHFIEVIALTGVKA